MTEPHDLLLQDIERFLAESGLSPSAFGVAAINDPRFVFELRAGRECRRSTRQKVQTFMAAERAKHSAAA